MAIKELFINSINMVCVDDYANIPTILLYQGNKILIGRQATEFASSSSILNDNFKVELGNLDPRNIFGRRLFLTESGESKSAYNLTSDFIEALFKKINDWIDARGLTPAKNIIIAEPVYLHKDVTNKNWLPNYRDHLRRMLSPRFDTIDFLPEPFAVFQYYRYGLRHPLVAGHIKHVAMILDFGGGTFDVSVVETTVKGDISAGGRNSRPLAASSIPIGGYHINEQVAEKLLFSHITDKEKKKSIRTALNKYYEWRRDPQVELTDLRGDYQSFIRHFRSLVFHVEHAKIAVCSAINDWGIETEYSIVPGAQVQIPLDPLKEKTDYASARLDAYNLREIFVNKIWKTNIYPLICSSLEKARNELQGQQISVILLSGGSSNIRWLGSLIRDELIPKLGDAELLELREDFQEIVSKGLAVECTRRFFSQDGDFGAVTYNRLCLVLDPDTTGTEIRPFKPVTEGLPEVKNLEGVLLPSASALRSLYGQNLIWKVKLNRPPRKLLNYYFLNSSFDPSDVQNLHNIDHAVVTPRGTSFGSTISVNLIVREDGTATPEFVYSKESRDQQSRTSVQGKPFYLDMTCAAAATTSEAYLGFDFGSSNSSISYVDRSGVTVYRERSENKAWKDLNELVWSLPYPVAVELASYMAQNRSDGLAKEALSVLESILTLVSYGTYQEYRSSKNKKKESRIFSGFTKRSIGPLWKLLRESLNGFDTKINIFSPFERFLKDEMSNDFNQVVTTLAQIKHDKASQKDLDHFRWVQALSNLTNEVFTENIFGYFENVTRCRFRSEYEGIFRCAYGPHKQFVKTLQYRGNVSFFDGETFIYNKKFSTLLKLTPLIFMNSCPSDRGHQHDQCCFIYDSYDKEKGKISYKIAGLTSQHEIEKESDADELFNQIIELREKDISLTPLENISLNEMSFD